MKQVNQLTIQFWLVRPESDHSTLEQMRELGQSGIYAPVFTSGQRMLLNMVARFDADDQEARISAALYAVRNAKAICRKTCSDCEIFGPEVWINGEKIQASTENQP